MGLIRKALLTGFVAFGGVAGVAALGSRLSAQTAARPIQPQPVTSLLGRVLMPRPSNPFTDSARAALAAQPEDPETLIATGQALDEVWQFDESIGLYTRAIAIAPGDPRPLSHRGLRYISTRQFDRAIADLEQARAISPRNFHTLFHLGLAYYYAGRYADAAVTLASCTDSTRRGESVVGDTTRLRLDRRGCDDLHDGLRYALTSWQALALMRDGRAAEARGVLERLPYPYAAVDEGRWYFDAVDIMLDRKPDTLWKSEAVKGGGVLTIGYALANHVIARGDSTRGCSILRELVGREEWPGFGYVGAEVDLARGRCKGIK